MSSVPPPYPGDGQGQQPSQPSMQPYGQPPQKDTRTQTILIIGLGIIIVLILGIGGVLIARSGDVTTTEAKSTTAGSSTSTTGSGTDDATSTTAGQTPSGNGNTNSGGNSNTGGGGSGNNSGGGNSGGGGGGGGGNPTTAPSSLPAVITSFTTPDDIDCHNGMSQNFTASWSTTNATKVTISIDGPGVYKTYPANGSDSLPFNCSSSHTFLLTAYSQDGSTVTRSITLNPRNVQSSTPSPDDEP